MVALLAIGLLAATSPAGAEGAAGLLADDPGLRPAAGLFRGLWIAGGLIAGGIAVVRAVLVARGRRLPAGPVQRMVAVGVLAAVIGSVATPPLRAAMAAGTWATLADVAAIERQLAGPVGWAVLLTAGGLAAAAWSLRRHEPAWRMAGALGGGAAVVAPLVTGHAVSMEPAWLGVGAMGAHLLAVATWIGGLSLLAVVLWVGRRDGALAADRRRVAADVSGLALLAVVIVALAGTAMAVVQVERVSALATSYGAALTVKVALLGVVLALALRNRRQVRRVGDEDGDDDGRGAAALGRGVRFELLGIAAILVASATLSSLEPAGQAAAEPVSQQAEAAGREVLLVIDPAVAGANELHLYVLRDGTPDGETSDARVRGVGPGGQAQAARPLAAGPGHWVDPGWELPAGGSWEVAVAFELDGELVEADFTVSISE